MDAIKIILLCIQITLLLSVLFRPEFSGGERLAIVLLCMFGIWTALTRDFIADTAWLVERVKSEAARISAPLLTQSNVVTIVLITLQAVLLAYDLRQAKGVFDGDSWMRFAFDIPLLMSFFYGLLYFARHI